LPTQQEEIVIPRDLKMPMVLSREDLRDLLTMPEVIEAVEEGFVLYKKGLCTVPVRMPVKLEKSEGLFLFMPASVEEEGAFGTKIVSVFPKNPAVGLPTIDAVYLLNDPATGRFLALMDGILLTSIRTGATSAVATKHLARKDASTLGIIGTGAQAAFQAEGVCAVRPIERVWAYDLDRESARRFAAKAAGSLGIPVEVAPSPREVVAASDVLVTVTTSAEPVFDGRDLKPGTHINAVGTYNPEIREIDDETVKRSRIVVDTYEGCLAEAGDLLIPMKAGVISRESIHADLGEIILGLKPGRTGDDEITLFESVGFALEDLKAALLAYEKARAQGVGLELSLEGTP